MPPLSWLVSTKDTWCFWVFAGEMSRAIDYTGRVLEKQRGCTLTLQFHALTRWFGFVSKIGFTTTLYFLHLTSGDKHMGFGNACIFETNPFWTTWSGWCAGHNHWISQRVIVGQPKWWECFMYPDVYIYCLIIYLFIYLFIDFLFPCDNHT